MRRTLGFSLLELLIVMAMVAILIMVAYPLYSQYLAKGRRNQAEITLTHAASQLEYYYSLNDTYANATLGDLGVPDVDNEHTYEFEIQSATDTGYIVSATPINQQIQQDASCGVLSLNEIGEQMNSGKTPSAQCWQ